MGNEKTGRLNKKMKDLLKFYTPHIKERWEVRKGYQIMGSLSWIEIGSTLITQIQKSAEDLCTEEKMSKVWIPLWIQAIKDKALDGGNADSITTIMENWEDYYS